MSEVEGALRWRLLREVVCADACISVTPRVRYNLHQVSRCFYFLYSLTSHNHGANTRQTEARYTQTLFRSIKPFEHTHLAMLLYNFMQISNSSSSKVWYLHVPLGGSHICRASHTVLVGTHIHYKYNRRTPERLSRISQFESSQLRSIFTHHFFKCLQSPHLSVFFGLYRSPSPGRVTAHA